MTTGGVHHSWGTPTQQQRCPENPVRFSMVVGTDLRFREWRNTGSKRLDQPGFDGYVIQGLGVVHKEFVQAQQRLDPMTTLVRAA